MTFLRASRAPEWVRVDESALSLTAKTMRTSVALLGMLAVTACSVFEPSPIRVESEEFPGIQIECVGEAGLSADRCRAWAEELLSGPAIDQPEGVGRLVLTFRTGNARCAADSFTDGGPPIVTVAAVCPAAG